MRINLGIKNWTDDSVHRLPTTIFYKTRSILSRADLIYATYVKLLQTSYRKTKLSADF